MADDGAKIDYPAHERAYHRFLRLSRIGAIASIAIAALVVFLITR